MADDEALSQLLEVLRKMNAGDYAARMATESVNPEIHSIVAQVNHLAETLQRRENASREKPIGFLEKVLDHIPIDIAIFDQDFKYAFLNRSAVKDEKLRKWMIGHNEFEYCAHRGLDPKIAENRYVLYQGVLAQGEMVSFREDLINTKGEHRAFLRTLCPIYQADGSMDLMLGCGIEITSLAETESALRIKNVELDKTNTELDHFVYRASHEMRGPVTSMMGLLSLAAQEDNPPMTTRYLELIEKSAVKLDTFIREISDYSINARTELSNVNIDVLQIVAKTREDLQYLDPANVVEVDLKVVQTCEWGSDPIRVKMLIHHLLSNSIKYRDPQKSVCRAEIQVEVRPSETYLTISDNGKGIHPDHRERLFDMFFRATNDAFGSGLGLYIVAEVLEKLGGSLEFESAVGQGTIFKLRVPNRVVFFE
jgi:signal transduction histidine kinase